MLDSNQIYLGDCLEVMKDIDDNSIDCVITDPPYGTTACKWDSVIPFEPMWNRLKRIAKDRSAIVLFGSEPFSSHLRLSNLKMYKYDWIWNKKLAGNGILAKIQPLKIHELIHIFTSSKGKINYQPQKTIGKLRRKMTNNLLVCEINNGNGIKTAKETYNNKYYPKSIQEFSLANHRRNRLHPTQKPVALIEYLIKTYTNENQTVLDFTAGSGTTGVACQNLNRNYIMIEKDKKYFEVAKDRLEENDKRIKEDSLKNIGC